MGTGISPARSVCLFAAAFWLAGCASSHPARFYTLDSAVPQEVRHPLGQATSHVSVSIASVDIPDSLDRPQIVTRDGASELKLAEYDRWAGSLSDNVAIVMAENLALLLGSDRVFVHPRPHAEIVDYAVSLRVVRLDCVPGDKVLLKAQWTVAGGRRGKDAATHLVTFTRKLNVSGYDAVVAAIDQALAPVSGEIGREIESRQKGAISTPIK